jgi:thiol-disulfide isomerase/thioredoxin
MTKIQDILFFRLVKPYGRVITMVFLALMLIIIVTFVFSKYVIPLMDKKLRDNTSNANLRDVIVDVRFFSVNWCPSCVKAKPEWKKFVDKYDKQKLNGFKINCINVDCTNDKDPMIIDTMSTYNIVHFPTIKIVKEKETIDYEGKVTLLNLEQFINSL